MRKFQVMKRLEELKTEANRLAIQYKVFNPALMARFSGKAEAFGEVMDLVREMEPEKVVVEPLGEEVKTSYQPKMGKKRG